MTDTVKGRKREEHGHLAFAARQFGEPVRLGNNLYGYELYKGIKREALHETEPWHSAAVPIRMTNRVALGLAMLEFDIGYRIAHHDEMTKGPQLDVTELKPGDSFMINDVMVTTAATEHPPVSPTIGYRLEHDGVSVALVGDTNPCEGVDVLAAGADAYLQSVIRKDLVRQIPMEMIQDILDYHSDVVEAAQTAARVGAKRLMLTHMVPAPPAEQYDAWIALAAEHFDGEIILGDDLTTVSI